MEANFIVHSVTEEDVPMMAKIGGVDTMVRVPGLTVELQADNGSSCHTHRFVPADMEAAKALFTKARKSPSLLAQPNGSSPTQEGLDHGCCSCIRCRAPGCTFRF
jgi:hypothetical protein